MDMSLMGGLLISRDDCNATSARWRRTAHGESTAQSHLVAIKVRTTLYLVLINGILIAGRAIIRYPKEALGTR